MKTTKKIFVTMIMLAIGIVFFANASILAQQSFTPGKVRELKYESGVFSLEKETKMKVTMGQDQITFQPKGRQEFSIPFKSIFEVAYDTKSQRRTNQAAMLAAVSPLGGMILLSMKKTKHYVSIVWEEEGIKKDVLFEVPKDERTSLLNELQNVTGKPWRDLDSEQKKTIQELEGLKNKSISLELNRQTQVGAVSLKPGLYQIVVIERENGMGELHFFEGKKVKPAKSLVSVKVEILNQSSSVTATQVNSNEQNGTALISEIQTPTRTFKITN